MAHFVLVEEQECLVDIHYYCSDFCAKSDSLYAGWFGNQEIHDSPEWCASCGDALGYYTSEGRWVNPVEQGELVN
jgi:hypothetical protein